MNLTKSKLISAMFAAVLLPGAASASIVAIAQGAATGPFTGPTYVDAFGSNAATARITAYPFGPTSFVNEAFSSTIFDDLTCLYCGQSMDARATGDGTGKVKLFSGIGMSTGDKGIALARLEIEDILDITSTSLDVSLNTFFSRMERGPSTLFPFQPYLTHANFDLGLTLTDANNPANSYSVTFQAVTAFSTVPLSTTEYWIIQEAVDGGTPVTVSGGPTIASSYAHLGFSKTIAVSPGAWLLSFYADTESLCSGPAPECPSTFDSWNTTHVGIEGGYTSRNGYQYLGLADPAPVETPEPGTLSFLLPVAIAGLLVRRRAVRSARSRPPIE